MCKKIICILALISLSIGASAQDIDVNDLIRRYTGENGNKYMQPVADALGANLNSGLFHSAMIQPGIKPQIYIGLTTMVAPIPESSKIFTATTEGSYFPTTTVDSVPTLFGDPNGYIVGGPGGTKYYFPGGLDINYVPFAAPQLSIGSLFGTDLTIRYASANYFVKNLGLEDEDWINKFRFFGWGFRHSISQWLGDLTNIDIAVGYYSQSITSRDYLDIRASLISLQASYQKSLLTVYGGIGIESGSLQVKYEDDNLAIDYDLTGVNNVRVTLGATLNAGPVKLNAEYNVSEQSAIAVGLGIGINELKKEEKSEEKW